jgi:UDP-2,4-diacetamido-2,4,6-trideoxy-beta-L-altropyranose hydrolase
MRVLFRADASVEIGTGHVVRCVTLADALRQQGADVAFACRALAGDLLGWLGQKNFKTLALEDRSLNHLEAVNTLISCQQIWGDEVPVDWLVVDHYALDATWERAMRCQCRRIMVIDDLANRPHDCDLLLDQNQLDVEPNTYQRWVSPECQQLLGPKFALLRPEFTKLRQHINKEEAGSHRFQPGRYSDVANVLIFFGGSDPTGECFKALDALKVLPPGVRLQVDLVAGAGNPQYETLQARCRNLPDVTLHRQVNAMADLMHQATVSIGAGGGTTWERFCLGLPSLVIAVADNQVAISETLAQQGYHLYLGQSSLVTPTQLAEALQTMLAKPEQRQVFSQAGLALVDGQGTQRVLEAILKA